MLGYALAGQKGRDMSLALKCHSQAQGKGGRGGYGAYARKWRYEASLQLMLHPKLRAVPSGSNRKIS